MHVSIQLHFSVFYQSIARNNDQSNFSLSPDFN